MTWLWRGTEWRSGTQTIPPPGGGGGGGGFPTFQTPDPSQVTFRGDYQGGTFSRWPGVANNISNLLSGSAYDALPPGYPAQTFTDPTYGHAARFELRSGDRWGGTERTELDSFETGLTGGTEGQTRWYEYGIKFDTSMPNARQYGFCLVNQWRQFGPGFPPVSWFLNYQDNMMSLSVHPQSSPNVTISEFAIMHLPYERGVWQHLTHKFIWSASDTIGSIEVWKNQVKQTFTNGSQQYRIRTLVPGSPNVYYKEGIYRLLNVPPTYIIWHAGFRCCLTHAGLTRPVI